MIGKYLMEPVKYPKLVTFKIFVPHHRPVNVYFAVHCRLRAPRDGPGDALAVPTARNERSQPHFPADCLGRIFAPNGSAAGVYNSTDQSVASRSVAISNSAVIVMMMIGVLGRVDC